MQTEILLSYDTASMEGSIFVIEYRVKRNQVRTQFNTYLSLQVVGANTNIYQVRRSIAESEADAKTWALNIINDLIAAF